MNHRQDLKSSTDVGEDARSAVGTLTMPSSTTRTLQRPEQNPHKHLQTDPLTELCNIRTLNSPRPTDRAVCLQKALKAF